MDSTRASYCCETEIWPIGFRALRLEYSEVLRQMVSLTLEIKDGGDKGPVFRITLDFARGPGREGSKGEEEKAARDRLTFWGRKPSKPWKDAFDRLSRAEREFLEEKAERTRRRAEAAARGGAHPCTFDPEEQMLRKKVGRLYNDKAELECAILKERVAILEELREEGEAGPWRAHRGQKEPVDRRTFFTRRVAALIEGLPGADQCNGYRFLEERCPEEPEPLEPLLSTTSMSSVAHERRKQDDDADERRRRKEEAKGQTLLLRAREKEERKKAKEVEKTERRARMAEERRRREERKELEKDLRRLHTRVDGEIARRRLAVRTFLQGHIDQEALETKLSDIGEVLSEDATLDGYDTPLPPPRTARPRGMLRQATMGGVLQIWDFLYTFAPKLGLSEVPSLSVLLRALDLVDAGAHRPLSAKERQRVDLLGDVALKLVGALLPDLVRTLTGPTHEVQADKVPLNRLTWPDLARSHFLVAGFRMLEVIGDPGLALRGRGVNFQLDLTDRRVLALARLRLLLPLPSHRLHGHPTAVTLLLPLPSPSVLQPFSWQACIETMRLLPQRCTDLITAELDRAIRGVAKAKVDPFVGTQLAQAKDALAEGEEGVGRAVDLAVQAMESHAAQLRAMGVQRVVEGVVTAVKVEGLVEMDDMDEEEFELEEGGGKGMPHPISRTSTGEGSPQDGMRSPTPQLPGMSPPPQLPGMQQRRGAYASRLPREEGEDDDDDEEEEEEEEIGPQAFEHRSDMVRRCAAIVQALRASPHAFHFLRKPSRAALPDYYDTVARPLALHDILRNLLHGLYDASVGLFASDVRLIFANCASFNIECEPILLDAEKLGNIFERLLLSWVLDPSPPPLSSLTSDHCPSCREPPPPLPSTSTPQVCWTNLT